MDKKKIHHVWTQIRPISYWYFFAAFLISGIVFVFAYRKNNLTALKLRDNLLQVDKQNGDVEAALKELRQFTYAHMNAGLSGGANNIYPPIQLKYRYERLVQAEKDRVSAENAKIYNEAQNTCEKLYPQGLSGRGRIPCIQQYVDSHGVKEQPIPDALYKFDFVSPVWSSDIAGWSLVVSLVFLLLFIVRFGLGKWLKHSLAEHL
jgi:hypothetical protein